MTKEELIEYCLSLPASYEDYPFEPKELAGAWAAMRHLGTRKSFAFVYERDGQLRVNLKCDPIEADFLRRVYECVTPAFHMNKEHWNTVSLGGDVHDEEVCSMIDASYNLTRPKTRRVRLI